MLVMGLIRISRKFNFRVMKKRLELWIDFSLVKKKNKVDFYFHKSFHDLNSMVFY